MKKYLLISLILIITLLMGACAPAPAAEESGDAAASEEAAAEESSEEGAEEDAAGEEESADGEEASGDEFNAVLLPKFLGILVFDQAHQGAMEAAEELGTADGLEFLGPTPENSVEGQIEIVTTAATQGVDAIMISNNASFCRRRTALHRAGRF